MLAAGVSSQTTTTTLVAPRHVWAARSREARACASVAMTMSESDGLKLLAFPFSGVPYAFPAGSSAVAQIPARRANAVTNPPIQARFINRVRRTERTFAFLTKVVQIHGV
jgi:hypothetical protein